MVQAGWAEEARAHAGATLLSLGGSARTTCRRWAPAWRRAEPIGHCLDAALAVLAALGAQALHGARREPPPELAGLVADVRAVFPPVEDVRPLGPDADALADSFRRRVFAGAAAPSLAD